MTNPTIPQTVRFPDLFDKPLVATFNREQASSDGGAVLLKAAERVYGLVKAFARCLVDKRRRRRFGTRSKTWLASGSSVACGHPDGNDADHLADDPIHKLLLGRDPVAGGRLASQPTISRFENDAGAARPSIGWGASWRRAPSGIGADWAGGRDASRSIWTRPTRTHGAQQLTFFNSHYDSWCYLPLLAFVRFDREVEQYLCAAVLRPGNRSPPLCPPPRPAMGMRRSGGMHVRAAGVPANRSDWDRNHGR